MNEFIHSIKVLKNSKMYIAAVNNETITIICIFIKQEFYDCKIHVYIEDKEYFWTS